MRWVLNKHLVWAVSTAFLAHVSPLYALPASPLAGGRSSAAAAAALRTSRPASIDTTRSLRYALGAGAAYAQPDTTDFEFPEEKDKHLVRDITVFVIASVFVAYFIIKVFLEGDTDTQPPDDGGNGKPPPPL